MSRCRGVSPRDRGARTTAHESGRFVASSCRARAEDFALPGTPDVDATQTACFDLCPAEPDLDGYDVARTVRAEHGSDAVLIAMTGYGQPTDRERSAEAGFDCHLVKPVKLDEIVHLLDQRIPTLES